MPLHGLQHLELAVLFVLLFVVVLAALAKRLETPYAIILMIGGLLLGLIPGIPHLHLNPNVFFLVILPPLLFSGAFLMPWRDFRNNLSTISMLAVGLVGFTVFGIAAAARWLLPGFDWRTGLVLGAVVAATDPIAATAIGKRLGLPRRLTHILEGESLVNDATGLLALEFATALVVSGHTPGIAAGAGRLLYLTFGSIAIGLIVGKIIHEFERRIAEAPIEITISLLAPYFAYLGAEALHASGVMSTVACGLYLGHRSSVYFSRDARVQSAAVWDTLTFGLNGIVFILIGLQLPYIRAEIVSLHTADLLRDALIFSAVVILLRLVWMYPAAWASNWVRRRLRRPVPFSNPRAVFIMGWTGMRGALGLAAALALPEVLDSGARFPQRSTIIFLTFCVIFVTLVLQGLTLPSMIRGLGLARGVHADGEEEGARRSMVEAAIGYLEAARKSDTEEFAPVYEELARFERRRLSALQHDGASASAGQSGYRAEDYERMRAVLQNMRAVQRAAIFRLRNDNKINDDVLRRLEHELDLRSTVSEHL